MVRTRQQEQQERAITRKEETQKATNAHQAIIPKKEGEKSRKANTTANYSEKKVTEEAAYPYTHARQTLGRPANGRRSKCPASVTGLRPARPAGARPSKPATSAPN